MPTSTGMPQIVEPKILDSRFPERILPSSIRKLPPCRLPLVGEAKHRVLSRKGHETEQVMRPSRSALDAMIKMRVSRTGLQQTKLDL